MKQDKISTQIADWYGHLDDVQKKEALVLFALIFIDTFMGFTLLFGALRCSFKLTQQTGSYLGEGLKLYKTSLLLTVGTLAIISQARRTISFKNEIERFDARGIGYSKNATYGSARDMDDHDAEDVFDLSVKKGESEKALNTIWGYLYSRKYHEKRIVQEKTTTNQARHTLIIGGSGCGKSFSYFRPEIVNVIKRGESFVVSDTKGELYTTTAQFARDNGYDVKVLNFKDYLHSDCWNCFEQITNHDTERFDSAQCDMFVDTFFTNTNDSKTAKGDPFFIGNAKFLFKASIGYIAYSREKVVIDNLQALFKKVSDGLVAIDGKPKDEIFSYFNASNTRNSIKKMKEYCRKAGVQNNYSIEDVNEYIKKMEECAPPFSFSDVFNFILYITDNVMTKEALQIYDVTGKMPTFFDDLPENHYARMSWNSFFDSKKNDEVRSAKVNMMQRLNGIFDENSRRLLSNQGIDISSVRKHKSAIYVVFSPDNETCRPFLSLFFTMLINNLSVEWSKYENNEKIDPNFKNTLLPYNVILDEAFNLGQIGGSDDWVNKKLALMRSYKVKFSFCFQTAGQITEMFGGEAGKAQFFGNCPYKLFLGISSGDKETTRDLSLMCGDATVQTESHQEMEKKFSISVASVTGEQFNMGVGKRPVMTPDEIAHISAEKYDDNSKFPDKAIVFMGGNYPLVVQKFGYIDLKEYQEGKLDNCTIELDYKPLDERDDISLIEDSITSGQYIPLTVLPKATVKTEETEKNGEKNNNEASKSSSQKETRYSMYRKRANRYIKQLRPIAQTKENKTVNKQIQADYKEDGTAEYKEAELPSKKPVKQQRQKKKKSKFSSNMKFDEIDESPSAKDPVTKPEKKENSVNPSQKAKEVQKDKEVNESKKTAEEKVVVVVKAKEIDPNRPVDDDFEIPEDEVQENESSIEDNEAETEEYDSGYDEDYDEYSDDEDFDSDEEDDFGESLFGELEAQNKKNSMHI